MLAEQVQVQLSHRAMGTYFEVVLIGQKEDYLRGVAEEVMREIDRWEQKLSYYREDSLVRQINAEAAYHPVYLDPSTFALLMRARQLHEWTDGTFDITVAPLMRCWGFVGASGEMPSEEAIAQARAVVGMEHVALDADNHTIAFDRAGVEIDLGSIGKGFAIERAVQILEEYEIENALIHGGTSAVYGLGTPPDAEHWKIALQKPFGEEGQTLGVVELSNNSLSVSAPHGKWFASGGKRYGHVLDPRTGYPISRNLLAAIVLPSPTDGDALSTGLLTLGPAFLTRLQSVFPDVRALVAVETEGEEMAIYSEGISLSASTALPKVG